MQIKLNLLRDHLRAVLVTAADGDIRYYFNGVCIEAHPKVTYLISCDGRRLGLIKTEPGDDVPQGGVEFIVPREAIETIKPNRRIPSVIVTYDTEAKTVAIDDFSSVRTVKAVDGRFPDWRRVMPAKVSGEPAQFDAKYLADLQRIAKVLGVKTELVQVRHGGMASALITMGSAPYVGVLMPVRSEHDSTNPMTFPEARPEPQKEKEEAAA